jgi:hypothetical protein
LGIIDRGCPAEFYAIIIEIIMTINRFSELISVAIRDLSSGLSLNHLKVFQYPRVLCDLRTGVLIMILTEFKMYVPVGSIHQRPSIPSQTRAIRPTAQLK